VIAALFAATTVLGAPYSWATPVFTGPTSPYYIDNFNDHTIYVVQGTSVINSFPWAYGPEGSLAVTNVVSTNGFGGSGTAGQYTLGGTPTGTSWPTTLPLTGEVDNIFYDGTSDGTHNYTVENYNDPNTTAKVIATDLNWQHPVGLFSLPGALQDYMGVAYDPQNDSLWISGYHKDVIADYSLNGTLLSSFTTDLPAIGLAGLEAQALGFDPADSTLWFARLGFNTLYQYSTSGVFLQSGIPSGLPTYFGTGGNDSGDFAEPSPVPVPVPSPVPEPSAFPLFGE
jgi:hypothetical protein